MGRQSANDDLVLLETKYRDIADGNFFEAGPLFVGARLETKYRDIADSKQVY